MMHVAVLINDPTKSWMSRVVQIFTKSVSSHVELVFSDGVAAIVTPSWMALDKRKEPYDLYHWVMVPLPFITDEMETSIRASTEAIFENEPEYDYLGAVSGYFGSTKQNSSQWYCSELIVDLLRDYVPEFDEVSWATPDFIWKTLVDKL